MTINYRHEALNKAHRYYISSKQDNNCVICLINKTGKMTQDKVGQVLGLTKMRISQIEKQALAKLRKRAHKFINISDLLN